ITHTLSAGKRVALFLGYNGTLRARQRKPSLARPNPALDDFLKGSAALPKGDASIISGRSRDNIQAWLGAHPFRLIAEHGPSRRQPGSQVWEQLDGTGNYAWKEELLTI